MTIREAFEYLQYEDKPFEDYSYKPEFEILFYNETTLYESNATQYTCESNQTKEEVIKELEIFFEGFCEENDYEFEIDSVEEIIFLGSDPFYANGEE